MLTVNSRIGPLGLEFFEGALDDLFRMGFYSGSGFCSGMDFYKSLRSLSTVACYSAKSAFEVMLLIF